MVDTLPFRVTGIAAGGDNVHRRVPRLLIVWMHLPHTQSPATAEDPVFGDTGVRAGGAVTAITCPAASAHAPATVTVAVICKTKFWVS